MLLKPAAALAVSEASRKKPGPRPGGDPTAGGTAPKRPAPRRLPIAPRGILLRAPVPSDRGVRSYIVSLRPPSADAVLRRLLGVDRPGRYSSGRPATVHQGLLACGDSRMPATRQGSLDSAALCDEI